MRFLNNSQNIYSIGLTEIRYDYGRGCWTCQKQLKSMTIFLIRLNDTKFYRDYISDYNLYNRGYFLCYTCFTILKVGLESNGFKIDDKDFFSPITSYPDRLINITEDKNIRLISTFLGVKNYDTDTE